MQAVSRKKVIIIGASSGIGKALAELYAEKGCLVGIAARRSHLLKKIAQPYNGFVFWRSINVCNREIAIRRFHELVNVLGGVDLVIYCSAVGHQNPSLDWLVEKETIQVNIEGFTSFMLAIYKLFKKQGGGHLVSISSIAGIRGMRFAPAYSSSKAYQMNYLESLRHLSVKNRDNIYVTDIRPGFVDTPMAQGDSVFWASSPKKAAIQIYRAIKFKKKIAYITHRWYWLHWIIKLMPSFIYNRI